MKEISNKKISIFQHFLCPIDWKLNKILKECLKHEIRRVYEKGDLFLEVEFSDMTHYEFWDCNRWDAWLMYGRFWRIFDSEDNRLYRYSGKRPTRRTMNKFIKAIKEHIKSACPNGDGISR